MCKFHLFPSLLLHSQAHGRVPNLFSPLSSQNWPKFIYPQTRLNHTGECSTLSPAVSLLQTHGLSTRVCPQPVVSPKNFLPFTYGSVHGRVSYPCASLVLQTSSFAFLLLSICFVFVFFPSNHVQSFYK